MRSGRRQGRLPRAEPRHVRRFVSELRAEEAVRATRATTTASRPTCAISCKGKHGKSWNWKGSSRGFRSAALRKEVLEQRDAAARGLARLLDAHRRRSRGLPLRELAPLVVAYEELKTRVGQARLSGSAAPDARPPARRSRRAQRAAAAVHAPPGRRVPGHRSAAGRDPPAAPADDPAETRPGCAPGPCPASSSSWATRSSRSTAFRRADVALYEATKRSLVAAAPRSSTSPPAFAALPSIQEAVNARLRAAHARERRREPGRRTCRSSRFATSPRAARRSSRFRCRAPIAIGARS